MLEIFIMLVMFCCYRMEVVSGKRHADTDQVSILTDNYLLCWNC